MGAISEMSNKESVFEAHPKAMRRIGEKLLPPAAEVFGEQSLAVADAELTSGAQNTKNAEAFSDITGSFAWLLAFVGSDLRKTGEMIGKAVEDIEESDDDNADDLNASAKS